MKIRHTRVTAITAGTGLAATALVATAAYASAGSNEVNAAPAGTTSSAVSAQAKTAKSLAAELGAARTAGSFIDESGKLVVNVTDSSAAQSVRAAGAQPKLVKRSGQDLNKIHKALQKKVTTTGTAYAVNPKTNTVVVSFDSSVTGAKLAKVNKQLKQFGSAVTTKKVPGRYKLFTLGGEAIYAAPSGRCSLGFNAKKGEEYFFVTAGHCTELAGKTWFADQGKTKKLGTATVSKFPGEDYAVVKYDAAPEDTKGAVKGKDGEVDITGAADATVGQKVTRSGSTTGVHEGEVTALDQTVNYQEGQVDGLIQTTVCAEPGDSGGSLYAEDKALGLTSGGSGNCTSGGETFFNPVGEALAAGGLEIY
ncbi:S1 family peptidase [Spirillospora sp. CA-294931]|uniref:S1 family peptidase n=1 Tax=Spirillospora sp. CA-294931 TaxID=3240042 RepID=UPI003D8DD731